MALSIGQKAPNFTLASTSGEQFSLTNDLKGQACVLYFYPKDFTPGCNAEACDFRDHFEEFKNLNILMMGISTDSIASHQKFKAKYNLPFELLSDKGGKVSKLYDALIPVLNLSRRVSYLIDRSQVIKAVYSDMFGVRNHIKAMIKEISPDNPEDNY